MEYRSIEVHRAARREVKIAVRYDYRPTLARIGAFGKVDVMIDELTPLPYEIGRADRVRSTPILCKHDVADFACVPAVHAGRYRGFVRIVTGEEPPEFRIRDVHRRVAQVVAEPVQGPGCLAIRRSRVVAPDAPSRRYSGVLVALRSPGIRTRLCIDLLGAQGR